jgi:serine/threonine-protein kinase HipA
MRQAIVFMRGIEAGMLTEENPKSYIFQYNDTYFNDSAMPDISLTLTKKQKEHRSEYLFPFFYNLLSEGNNKVVQCRRLKIDEKDYFGLLLATAMDDTTGAVTIKQVTI